MPWCRHQAITWSMLLGYPNIPQISWYYLSRSLNPLAIPFTTCFNINPIVDKKLSFNHFQTSIIAPLKFGYGWIISSHILLGLWLLIHAGTLRPNTALPHLVLHDFLCSILSMCVCVCVGGGGGGGWVGCPSRGGGGGGSESGGGVGVGIRGGGQHKRATNTENFFMLTSFCKAYIKIFSTGIYGVQNIMVSHNMTSYWVGPLDFRSWNARSCC